MINPFKGPGMRIAAAVIAVIALAGGIWVTFFHSHNYTAGRVTSSPFFGVVLMLIGGALLAFLVFFAVRQRSERRALNETQDEGAYLPSERGAERVLYFFTERGTPQAGYRFEDENGDLLYEAKMLKRSAVTPCDFVFIDHLRGVTAHHLIGHREATERNALLPDSHRTFTLDGEDIWNHLSQNGVTAEAHLPQSMVTATAYDIFRDGEYIACLASTGQQLTGDEAVRQKTASQGRVRGLYRIETTEKNLDLLFVTALAFAHSGAPDDEGDF